MQESVLVDAVKNFLMTRSPFVLVGNGLNLYKTKSQNFSWNSLLKRLVVDNNCKDDCKNDFRDYVNGNFDGLTNPELYDLINYKFDFLRNESVEEKESEEKAPGSPLQEIVCEYLKKWNLDIEQCFLIHAILCRLSECNIPLLTTNFDRHLENVLIESGKNISLQIKPGKKGEQFIGCSAYPWSRYFAEKPIDNIREQFAIWHMHGFIDFPASVHLGSNQYFGMTRYAKEQIRKCRDNPKWNYDNTWLNIFFNKSIVAFGLGLSTDESFLRWLLLERAYFLDQKIKTAEKDNNHLDAQKWRMTKHSLFLTTNESKMSYGQQLFLKICGFEIVTFDTRRVLYEDLWQNWPQKV